MAVAVNIVIVGNESVGKTSLLMYLIQESYDSTAYKPTIGIDFRVYCPGTGGIKARIWDTAGQAKFQIVTQGYCRNADGFLVVCDIANISTFNDLPALLTKLRVINPYAPIVVVGNKIDKNPVSAPTGPPTGSPVAAYFETSAHTGQNVDKAFQCLIGAAVEHKRLHPSPPPSCPCCDAEQEAKSHDRLSEPDLAAINGSIDKFRAIATPHFDSLVDLHTNVLTSITSQYLRVAKEQLLDTLYAEFGKNPSAKTFRELQDGFKKCQTHFNKLLIAGDLGSLNKEPL